MAYSVDWITKIITIPVTDLTLVSGTRYQLNLENFLYEIRRLEWDFADGLWAPKILEHSNIRTDFAGANYAAFDEVVNGYTVTIGPGPTRVDLVGSNNNIADVINNTDIILTSANSAGLTNINEIRSTAFNQSVVIDPNSTNTGIVYPLGTRKKPINNWADALAIAEREAITRFDIVADTVLTTGDFSKGYAFYADSPFITLHVENAANVANCDFYNVTLSGQLDGVNIVRECPVGLVTSVSGIFEKCAFSGNITLSGDTFVFESYSQIAGAGYPTFTCGEHNITFRQYGGSAGLAGTTAGHISSCGIYGGRLIIEASCTGGEIHARGEPFDIRQLQSADIVIDETEGAKVNKIHAANFHRRKHDTASKTITIFEADNITPLYVFDAPDDLSDITPQ